MIVKASDSNSSLIGVNVRETADQNWFDCLPLDVIKLIHGFNPRLASTCKEFLRSLLPSRDVIVLRDQTCAILSNSYSFRRFIKKKIEDVDDVEHVISRLSKESCIDDVGRSYIIHGCYITIIEDIKEKFNKEVIVNNYLVLRILKAVGNLHTVHKMIFYDSNFHEYDIFQYASKKDLRYAQDTAESLDSAMIRQSKIDEVVAKIRKIRNKEKYIKENAHSMF